MAIQSDGRIVAAGYGNPLAQDNSDFALARYNSDGTLDITFDNDGKVTTDFGSTDYGYSVAIQSDGKFVVAGYSGGYPSADFALARYNNDGSLDTSFDTDGKVTTNFGGWDLGQSVAIQSDGGIVAAGHTQSASFALDFALARYNANGSLDSAFGIGGKVTTDFGGGPDAGHSVAIQSDGKIVVAGSGGGGTGDFAVARYGGTVPPSNSPPLAVAGPDQVVNEGTTVQLDASASSDPDNDTLTFNWTVVSFTGPAITLSSSTVANPVFNAMDDGSYILKVTVDDGNGGTASDEVQVTVNNVAPNITAETDAATIAENGSVIVSGNITDPGTLDTHTVVIAWGPGESSTTLNLAAGVLTYTASHQYLDDNPTATSSDLYPIGVSVNDDDGGTGSANTQVTVNNVAPTASAGADQGLPFGSLVNISAAFADPGTNDTWTYSIDWGDGSPAATGSATVGSPITGSHQYVVAGNQTITVYVRDDDLGKGSDSLTVTFVSGIGKITGGVLRFGNNGRGGFNVQSNNGVTVKGELEYQNGSVNLHAHTMTAVAVSPDLKKGWFAGVLEDGHKFVVYVEDNGEPGRNDIFKIWVEGILLNGDGKLTGGNVQIHK
ncbi:MAG: hypothetical protein HY670_07670 [Chloroflexi bacterium]|nr:hypothetical protein [Chloroflexota bacterium]